MSNTELQPGQLPPYLKQMCEDIVTDPNIRYFPMQESLFVRDVLPMLAGDDKQLDMTFWLTKVGSYFKAIRVMNGDEVLFDVPPLFSSRAVHMHYTGEAGDSIYGDMEDAQRKAHIAPAMGINYLAGALNSRLEVEGPEVAMAYAAHINEILVRYKRDPIYNVKPLADSSAQTPTAAASEPEQDIDNGVELDD